MPGTPGSCPTRTGAARLIDAIAEPGDLVLTMGAGDITALGPRLVEILWVAGMTEPSGIVGQDADPDASPDEAAGDRPVFDVKSVPRIPSRWRALFFALVAAGVIGAGAWVLFRSPLLVVRSVSVRGTRLVPSAEVLAVSGVTPGTPLIRVNTGQAAARIEEIRQVSSAQVTRSWPDQVVIVVRERTPALAVAAPGGGYDLVDADGVVMRWAARRPADLPLIPPRPRSPRCEATRTWPRRPPSSASCPPACGAR